MSFGGRPGGAETKGPNMDAGTAVVATQEVVNFSLLGLFLSADWVVKIVKAVGNYGESYDRNVGSGSRLNIDRGLNKLWNQGGLQYAPPIR